MQSLSEVSKEMSHRKLNKSEGSNYTINVEREATKEIQKLSKIPNFSTSFDLFKKALPFAFCEREHWNFHRIFPIADLKCKCDVSYIIKKVHINGKYGNDKVRVVFIVNENVISIIEVYTKDKKEIEDKARICKYCTSNNSL